MSKSDLRKQFVAERNKKIIALHGSGMLTKNIAAEVNLSEGIISNTLKRAGLSSHGGLNKEARAERMTLIREKHAQGLTNSQIANDIGLSPSTVGQYVREIGLIPYRTPGLFSAAAKSRISFNDRIESVARLIERGLDRDQIAVELGVKIGAVNNWYSSARKMVSAKSVPVQDAVAPSDCRADMSRAPLPVGHPIVMDALWRGIEKYREPLAL